MSLLIQHLEPDYSVASSLCFRKFNLLIHTTSAAMISRFDRAERGLIFLVNNSKNFVQTGGEGEG